MNSATQGHILKRYDAELQKLEKRVVKMGRLVREQLERIQLAIREVSDDAAAAVIEGDRPINLLELKADKLIIKLIARRAPVGGDLRFIVAVSRLVNDLERLGDEAAYMARSLIGQHARLGTCAGKSAFDEIGALTVLASQLLDKAMTAFAGHGLVAAQEIAFGNAGPDGELQARLKRLTQCTLEQDIDANETVNLVLSIRCLERIGSHIRNIGEHVIYLVTGEDVRHQDEQ